ncbi:MAG: hypothetical protein U1E59_20305 [Amaricoccus sp.]
MTYEERTNAIGTLLRETILPRYTRPPHLDDTTARAELRDMVADLNAEWPLMSAERFHQMGQALARCLRLSYTGRNWPTIAHLAKALKAAQEAPTSALDVKQDATTGDEREEWRRAQLREWLAGNRPVNPNFVTRERLAAIGCREIEAAMAFAERHANDGAERTARAAVINSAPETF